MESSFIFVIQIEQTTFKVENLTQFTLLWLSLENVNFPYGGQTMLKAYNHVPVQY